MSWWVRVQHDRPRHPKWSSLSDAAYRFADKVLCWAAEYETDFVPEHAAYSLAGGPKQGRELVTELLDCGKAFGKLGLLETAPGGFRIHDATQYWPPGATAKTGVAGEPLASAPAKKRAGAARWDGTTQEERSDAARKAASRRWDGNSDASYARRHASSMRAGDASDASRNASSMRAGDASDASRNASRPKSLSSHTLLSLRSDGIGNVNTEEAAAKDLLGFPAGAREQQPQHSNGSNGSDASDDASSDASPDASSARIQCPSDLCVTMAQGQKLVGDGVPDWAIAALTARFVTKYVDDPEYTRSLGQWRRSLVTMISGDWQNPQKRPLPPDTPDNEAPGFADELWNRALAGEFGVSVQSKCARGRGTRQGLLRWYEQNKPALDAGRPRSLPTSLSQMLSGPARQTE